MAVLTRIRTNQIADGNITAAKIASGTLTGGLFASDITLNSNVTITGNLTLQGNTDTISATNTYVNDPLVVFNNGFNGSPTYDIGVLVNRNLTSLAPYGAVNAAWVWREADSAFEGLMTTETGTTAGSINNSGFANIKVGNIVAISGNITGTLLVGGAATFSSTTNQIGDATFTTGNIGGLQAKAIGNVTPGTAAFTTLSATGQTTLANTTTGGLQATAIGNATPGTAAFTTLSATSTSSLNAVTATTINTSGNIVANSTVGSLTIYGNAISSNTGKIGLGSISNVQITGGASGYAVTTDGAGNLSFTSILGNSILLGSNITGALTSNAATLTTTTAVTDAIATLNSVLGKLVPASPPNFPGATPLTLTGITSYTGLMSNFAQTDNTSGNTYQVSAGTLTTSYRVTNYGTTGLLAVGPGDRGTITVYLNGIPAGSTTLNGASSGTYGNLVIANNTDYHNIVSSVSAGFWYSANISATGATGSVAQGWNTLLINDSYNSANTNPVLWYVDSSTPGTPTFSNTSITLTTNTVVYSSTIPHLTNGSVFRLKGNVSNLSGDFYPNSTNLTSATGAAGALQAPAAITYSAAGVTTPLARNLYVGSGSAYFETTASTLATGFGSSSSGPTLTVNNNYASGVGTFAPGVTVLYKTGTTTAIEETSIPYTVASGSGTGGRIVLTSGTDTPTYTGSETLWNSSSTALAANDTTVVGSGTAGAIKCDQTNYSTGYLPVGPNLTTQSATQYFTFRFVQNSVSKFNVLYSGNIAGLWVAAPGTGIDTTSTLSGWLTMGSAYAGAGVPGAGAGGNGSNGCTVGTLPTYNSVVTNSNINATFGTVSTANSANHYVYVRMKLTAGQSVTALSIQPSAS